jgi:hypothetical protein
VSQFIRYKVDVEVFDGPETTKFVSCDSTLDDLLGMTASTLLEKQTQVNALIPNRAIRSRISLTLNLDSLIKFIQSLLCFYQAQIVLMHFSIFAAWFACTK